MYAGTFYHGVMRAVRRVWMFAMGSVCKAIDPLVDNNGCMNLQAYLRVQYPCIRLVSLLLSQPILQGTELWCNKMMVCSILAILIDCIPTVIVMHSVLFECHCDGCVATRYWSKYSTSFFGMRPITWATGWLGWISTNLMGRLSVPISLSRWKEAAT